MSARVTTAATARGAIGLWHRIDHLFRGSVRCLLAGAGAFLLGLAWLVRPFVRVRVANLACERIGTLLGATDYFLRRQTLAPEAKPPVVDLFVSSPHVSANNYVMRMVGRRARLVHNRVAFSMYHATRDRFPNSPVWNRELGPIGWEDYETWQGTEHQLLRFTDEECGRGEALLRSMGVPENAPYVCFAVRDRAYLNVRYAPESQWPPRSADYWSYHDYRDAALETYLPAVQWLVDQGYWVLRMGAIVERPLPMEHPRVVDYATRHRSEFGDVYILSKCRFFLGDTAGILWLPFYFGRPVALGNQLPIERVMPRADSLAMPKKFRRLDEDRFMSWREVFETGVDKFSFTREFVDAGIEPVENSAEEILAMTQEMEARISGTWRPEWDDELLQQRFWACIPDHPIHDARPGAYSPIATEFLRRNRDLLD